MDENPFASLDEKCKSKFPGSQEYVNICCDPDGKGKYSDGMMFAVDNGNIKKNISEVWKSHLDNSGHFNRNINLSNNNNQLCGKTLTPEEVDGILAKHLPNFNCEEYSLGDCTIPDSFTDEILQVCKDKGYNNVLDEYQACNMVKHDDESFIKKIYPDIPITDCTEPLPFCDMKAIANKASQEAIDMAVANVKSASEAEKKAILDKSEAEKKAILDKIAEDAKKKENENALSDQTWMIIVGSSVIGLLLLFIIIFAMMR
jgi:hypothetical protein